MDAVRLALASGHELWSRRPASEWSGRDVVEIAWDSSAISILPVFLISGLHLHQLWPPALGNFFDTLPSFINLGLGISFFFGGTSLLIVVGVAMDTVQQIESQLIMRNYDGFLKGTRIRGRRG